MQDFIRRALTGLIGLVLLVPVAFVSANIAGALTLGTFMVLEAQTFYPRNAALSALILLTLGSVAGSLAGIILTRFLIRVFPLQRSQRRRWILPIAILLIGAGFTVQTVYLNLHPITDPLLPLPPRPFARFTGLVVMWAQLIVAARVYFRTYIDIERPYILFLRRFRSFSDRAMYRALLTSAPSGVPIVALVPTKGGPRDFDPVVIGFTGFRWRHPFSSMPLAFSSPNDDWVRQVSELLAGAQWVVVDGSADSASMSIEYELLRRLRAPSKVLVILDSRTKSPPASLSEFPSVVCRRTIMASTPKALLVVVLGVSYLFLASLYPIEYPGILFWTILLVLPSLFQRSVDRHSKQALRRKLQEHS